jgi:primosomal protein N' (replication factor Y)
MAEQIAEVAVNVPLRKLFHYEVPPHMSGKLEVGHRVLVPFGGRTVTGVCVGFPDKAHVPKLKPIREVLHPHFRFDSHTLELTRWIADYYHAGWGEVLEAAMPPPVRSGKEEARVAWISPGRPASEMLQEAGKLGARARARARLLEFLAAHREPVKRADLLEAAGAGAEALRWLVEKGWAREEMTSPERPAESEDLRGLSSRTGDTLHPDQEAALRAFRNARAAGAFQVILLHGVTGSGKTEVYLRALREVLESGRRGLILVPEISLTPQMVHRFRQGLPGETVAVLHSMLGAPERMREWKSIQEGKAKLVIGARSAVFAPVPDLGLIVVDEEHDGSYKQETSPRYGARDVAVVRARMLQVPIILGSATPSLESMHNAVRGKYRLVELPRRVTSHDLPTVSIVPLTQDFYRLDGSGLISPGLDTGGDLPPTFTAFAAGTCSSARTATSASRFTGSRTWPAAITAGTPGSLRLPAPIA